MDEKDNKNKDNTEKIDSNPESLEENKMEKKEIEEVSDDILIEEIDEEGNPKDALKKLREKLKVCVAEKQKYLDGWQRDKADFVNSKRRDDEAQKEFIKFSNLNLISELIPVLDSYNMAMGNKEVWEKVDKNWRIGVEYIYNQLKKILEDNGLQEIDPIGKKFDPMQDEAIEYVKIEEEVKDHTVVSVIQKGYSLNGKILKAPKVRVGELKG